MLTFCNIQQTHHLHRTTRNATSPQYFCYSGVADWVGPSAYSFGKPKLSFTTVCWKTPRLFVSRSRLLTNSSRPGLSKQAHSFPSLLRKRSYSLAHRGRNLLLNSTKSNQVLHSHSEPMIVPQINPWRRSRSSSPNFSLRGMSIIFFSAGVGMKDIV